MTKLKMSYFMMSYIMRRKGSLEKTIMPEKNRRQEEKRKTKYKIDQLPKSHRHEATRAEQGC